MHELKGQVAIVTGASRGIGAACAEYLATLGVRVMLAARTADQIEAVAQKIRKSGGNAQAMTCDVSRYASVAAVIDATVSAFGTVDILINNAGVIEPVARLADSDPDAWGRVTDINYKGVFHGIRAVLPVMQDKGRGVIVNISSGAATSALEGWSHYCSSKAAVLMLTQCVHKEYADHGIRCVGLSPGTVATDMQVLIKATGINPVSQLDPSVHVPVEWPAKAVAYLCTDAGSSFDGGDMSLRSEQVRQTLDLPVS